MWRVGLLLVLVAQMQTEGKIESQEDNGESGDKDVGMDYTGSRNYTQKDGDDQIDESEERIGAAVTQVVRHPYAASLLKNDSYVCSAIILNTHWMLTLSKCFESNVISSYVTYRYLGNYTIRIGSSYNNKGGSILKIKMLINNFDLKVSAAKLQAPVKFTSQIQSVLLPKPDEEAALGYLASMIAWTPTGHIRVVNAPIIDSSICESSTKLEPGRYICVGGVQDPNRHFCRKDNGGAVIQNNTLIAISSFLHTCALYTKTHAFPKVSSFSRWLDSVIWDEDNRPTTIATSTSADITKTTQLNTSESTKSSMFVDPRKFMLTLPFDPINVPLEPAEDNSVIPRMSLYESYLQNLAKAKTSTTADPNEVDEKKNWLEMFGKSILMVPPQMLRKKYDTYNYK
ncbi:trypsin-5-like [Pararge aegeria]|uniref:Jg14295 protein n=1 Tax=Pararge aegeria aegeria TaxID=348720 RepID=A0A8S4R5Q0_9NEOP|nr:trypsin-5-like [Pararge aegeria]CAH2231712.1 jg14295 [Pararge aegeria aegeria]